MIIIKTNFKDLLLIQNLRYDDKRGFFTEIINQELLNKINKKITKKINFVQFNHSFSKKKYTVRGLHCQKPDNDQDKLIYCIKGKIIDFVVDFRKSSKNFGKYFSIELSSKNNKMIFIPKGFLHGFITLEDKSEIVYACSKFYSKKKEIKVNFFDKHLNIRELIIIKNKIISDKDKEAPNFLEVKSPFD